MADKLLKAERDGVCQDKFITRFNVVGHNFSLSVNKIGLNEVCSFIFTRIVIVLQSSTVVIFSSNRVGDNFFEGFTVCCFSNLTFLQKIGDTRSLSFHKHICVKQLLF